MGRLETELMTMNDSLGALADLSGNWIDQVHDRTLTLWWFWKRIFVLDYQSTYSE